MALRFRRRDIHPVHTGPRVNRDIRVPEVRVIDENGEQLGVMPVEEAIAAAEERDLDVVEVAPNSTPPVCKILDYGRYKYVQQKKAHEAKKRQRVVEIKEVKMRIKIENHDYGIKKRNAERFLNEGNKVKATIMFRGREVTHPHLGRKLLERLANDLIEIASTEQMPSLEGRNMTMVLAPKASPKPPKAAQGGEGGGKKAEGRTPKEEGGLKAPLAEALEKGVEKKADAEENAPAERAAETETEEGTQENA